LGFISDTSFLLDLASHLLCPFGKEWLYFRPLLLNPVDRFFYDLFFTFSFTISHCLCSLSARRRVRYRICVRIRNRVRNLVSNRVRNRSLWKNDSRQYLGL